MIRLHYSNRVENLIEPLAAAISVQQRTRPLERVTIVVPNRVIEHYLKRRVSEAIGIAANLEFPFLRNFLAGIIEAAEPDLCTLDAEELEVVLFENLRAKLQDDSPVFRAPRSYIEADQASEAETEIRALRLARQLAWLFREYSLTRRSMIEQWSRREDARSEAFSDTEKWQRQLWLSTFGANGYLRDEWKYNPQFDWILIPDAFDVVAASKLKAVVPPVVHVFGLAYAGPAYVRIFSQIGALTELNIYALNPCLEFWEDVQQLSAVDRKSWALRHSKIGGKKIEQSNDPFELGTPGDTPALRLWARPGREYIRMLNELTECDFDPHFATHSSSTSPSLLAALQEDILYRRPERAPATGLLKDDGSIRFLACPSIARETEIVANEIWSLLEDHESRREPIRFHQIGVLVPDAQYEDYLPHILSSFARLHGLPTNVVNSGWARKSPVCEAISLLLSLPLGRFARDEMLHLLTHPAIAGEDAALEADQARRWCEATGIFFGADADDLANTYIPRDTYNWDQGLRRLALGVFIGEDRNGDARFYSAPDGTEYLPYVTAEDEIPAVAAFTSTARRLLCDAGVIRSRRLALAQWSRLLSDLVLTYVKVTDRDEERIRERCIEAIESIASIELRSTPVSYQVAHEIVLARLAETESELGQFTEGGIALGPLSALRAIPFKAIFLLGLNEGQFPERDRRDALDIRLAQRRAGDVTTSERDRYMFLETILAARARICFSYVAYDASTGDRLQPASVVQELQFILRGYVDSHALLHLTIEHPLSRYAIEYFPELHSRDVLSNGALRSYDSDARSGATMALLRSNIAHHCEGLPLPDRDEPLYQDLGQQAQAMIRPALRLVDMPPAPSTRAGAPAEIWLPISALRKFLECPLQGAAQHALGIFEDDGEALDQWQDEVIAQSVLDRTILLREVFWKARRKPALLTSEYAKALRLSQLVGKAPVGPFAHVAERVDRQSIESWFDQAAQAGSGALERWVEIRMGRGDEFTRPDRVIGELSIPVRYTDPNDHYRQLVVKLHGSLGFLSPIGNRSLQLVLRDKPKAKDFLGRFLSAIALTAASELSGKQFHATVVGVGKHKSFNDTRILQCPSADDAYEYLSSLIGDLLFGTNHYFLPIEAVEEIHRDLARGGKNNPFDIVNDLRDNEYAKCSSDYGPIRDARRFEPPNPTTLQNIIDRRFVPLRGIFRAEKD